MPGARATRNAAAVLGLGLSAVYAFEAARYRRTLEKHFLLDLEDSRELDLRAWRSRPLAARARELGGALLRRQL